MQVPLRKDLASYPANKDRFQVILEDVPNSVYTTPYDNSTDSLKKNYAFSREMPSFFLRPILEFCEIASYNGAEIQISYFPSLSLQKNDVYTMRVELEVLSVTSAKNLKDICKTELDRPIKAGDKFFCDLNSNAPIPSQSINGGVILCSFFSSIIFVERCAILFTRMAKSSFVAGRICNAFSSERTFSSSSCILFSFCTGDSSFPEGIVCDVSCTFSPLFSVPEGGIFSGSSSVAGTACTGWERARVFSISAKERPEERNEPISLRIVTVEEG